MSSEISQSLIEIIKVFVGKAFAPLTLEQISKELKISEGTLNQRILRNEDMFKVVNQRPKTIALAPKDEIVFALYGNMCAACLTKKASDELTVYLIDETLPNPRAWENMMPLCKNCVAKGRKPIQKDVSKPFTSEPMLPGRKGWEYKILYIREAAMDGAGSNLLFAALLSKHNAYAGSVFFKFQEPAKSDEWHHLVDGGKISSLTIESILDHFGSEGWEVVQSDFTEGENGEREYLLKRARTC